MTEKFRNNRHLFVEENPDLKLKSKLYGTAASNSFIDHDSSPRVLMMSTMISQPIIINEPKENMVQSGVEYELSKSVIGAKVEDESEVIAVVKRTKPGDHSVVMERAVILKNLETGELDVKRITYANKLHPYFGFVNQVDEQVDKFTRGTFIPEDTMLSTPPTILPDGGYGNGRDVNIALISLPEVDEDGFIVSESFCKNNKFKLFESRTVDVGSNSFLLNMYGDEDNFKPFPEIGEYINDTGIVAATRELDSEFGPGLYSARDCMSFNPVFDNAVYTKGPGGKIVDIKVYSNNKKNKQSLEHTDESCIRNSESLLSYYRQIINIYESYNADYQSMFNKPIKVSKVFNSLLVSAYGMVESAKPGSPYKKMYRKENLDLFKIEFTIEYEMQPTEAYKISGMHGDKGVIVDIWKDEDMPVDKDGNRADLIADTKSTIGRTNVGRLYERYIKASLRKTRDMIRDEAKKIKYNPSNKKHIDKLFSIAVEYTTTILESELGKAYKAAYDNKQYSDMADVIDEILRDEFRVRLSIGEDKRKYEIVDSILKSKFCPVYDKVKFNYKGKKVITEDPVLIAPLYFILLSKIADTTLTTSSAKVNHFGLPIVVSTKDKYRLPYRNSPTRTNGETEGRIFVGYGGQEFLAELKDRNASVTSHAAVHHSILTAKEPTNIEACINRKDMPFGNERGLEILKSLWGSVGMELAYLQDKDRIRKAPVGIDDDIAVAIDNTIVDDDIMGAK